MPFFKDLRRRSKTSFRTSSSPEGQSNGDMMAGKSTSTLDTLSSNNTPPSSIKPNRSSPSLPTLLKSNGASSGSSTQASTPPQRPVPISSQSNRNSWAAASVLSVNGTIRTPLPASPYAPRVVSISDNSWVHQKVLLVHGQIGDPRHHPLDGTLMVIHPPDTFPPTYWPVSESYFKALVHLSPGPNKLRFDFTSPKLSSGSITANHSSWISINYLPLVNNPPLDLVILLGKDSTGTFDAVPERIKREGNGLDVAIRKYRMAAYLWQAFTGEQMFRNNFGRRCFRFEEEWQTGSLSFRDTVAGQMRNEAKVHVIRTDKTVAQLRELNVAQQCESATDKMGLFMVARDAVEDYFRPRPDQKRYVSVLLLDSHWETSTQTITGHAAMGSDSGNIKMAIFGSHCLQSYPSCLEEVVAALTDCTRTDTNYVGNDCGESGSNWEAANVGIGTHLHEIGHLFGCPHQESGVMMRDYVRLNRTFTTRESYSTRIRAQGLKLCLPSDECGWHRLDALRFRFHPCFRLPSDVPASADESLQVWPADNGKILLTAASGIAFIKLYAEGDDTCHTFIEYVNGESGNSGIPRQAVVTETELRQRLPANKQKKKVRLEIFSGGLGSHTIPDISLSKSKHSLVKLPNGQVGYRGNCLGSSQLEGSQREQLILECAFDQKKILTSIKIYHGAALNGLEFCYEDSTSQLFGRSDGNFAGDEFVLDARRGEILMGFYVRAGTRIDGIEILTSFGRKSGVYGDAKGGIG
ncbi:putative peptidase family domain containing protein [Elaphomyces granulatus]